MERDNAYIKLLENLKKDEGIFAQDKAITKQQLEETIGYKVTDNFLENALNHAKASFEQQELKIKKKEIQTLLAKVYPDAEFDTDSRKTKDQKTGKRVTKPCITIWLEGRP